MTAGAHRLRMSDLTGGRPPAPKPTLGRILHYVGKQGLRTTRAAIVTATADTLDPRGVVAGQVPALESADHVHLWVYTPSAAGGFQEFNVPAGDGPGTWHWPPRT